MAFWVLLATNPATGSDNVLGNFKGIGAPWRQGSVLSVGLNINMLGHSWDPSDVFQ